MQLWLSRVVFLKTSAESFKESQRILVAENTQLFFWDFAGGMPSTSMPLPSTEISASNSTMMP
jgi:hypothetical protein